MNKWINEQISFSYFNWRLRCVSEKNTWLHFLQKPCTITVWLQKIAGFASSKGGFIFDLTYLSMHFPPHLSIYATVLHWEITEHKLAARGQDRWSWVSSAAAAGWCRGRDMPDTYSLWLLEVSSETARHRDNTGDSTSPQPQGRQISVQSSSH